MPLPNEIFDPIKAKESKIRNQEKLKRELIATAELVKGSTVRIGHDHGKNKEVIDRDRNTSKAIAGLSIF
jgi:hypothetical protein